MSILDIAKIFTTLALRGLYDSVSFDKSLPVLINCGSVAQTFGKWYLYAYLPSLLCDHTHTHTHMYICICAYIYICIHICKQACIYVCKNARECISYEHVIYVFTHSLKHTLACGRHICMCMQNFDSIAANGILLLGSIIIFEYWIKAGMAIIGDFFLVEQAEKELAGSFSHFAYCLGIVPIWIICYLCSAFWYKDIVEDTYRHLKV